MNITKDGFYKVSECIPSPLLGKEGQGVVTIWDNLNITLFDDTETSLLGNEGLGVVVWQNSHVEYFSFFSKAWKYVKHFNTSSENSHVTVKSLIYAENNTIDVKIIWEISHDNNVNNVDILSFAWDEGVIKLDGILQIGSALQNVKWRLDEENIFLWDSWKISWIPTLLVATNDVEASHSCKMEKISDDKLFYLRSRWVDKENALTIMIEAKIKTLYKKLEQTQPDFFEEIITEILSKIK